jgi:hypothetical protein
MYPCARAVMSAPRRPAFRRDNGPDQRSKCNEPASWIMVSSSRSGSSANRPGEWSTTSSGMTVRVFPRRATVRERESFCNPGDLSPEATGSKRGARSGSFTGVGMNPLPHTGRIESPVLGSTGQ